MRNYFKKPISRKGTASRISDSKKTRDYNLRLDTAACNEITKFMEGAVEAGVFPGAVLGIAQGEKLIYSQAFGKIAYDDNTEVSVDTVYDLASLTKVLITTTAIMQLNETGKLNLHDYLKDFFPEVREELEEIRIDQLMTHTSGLPAIVQLWKEPGDRDKVLEYLLNLEPVAEPGQKVLYSDPNFLLLGFIVEKISGLKLADYARKYIIEPGELKKTDFNPLENNNEIELNQIAPTEYCSWREKQIHGEVHDENCAFLGGASGQAGLFSNVKDLVKLMAMILNQDEKKVNILSPASSRIIARTYTRKDGEMRGLGWDKGGNIRSSSGIYFGSKALGHTGFTGTSIWTLPESGLTVILLSNRVNGGRENQKIIKLRPRLHNLIYSLLSQDNHNTEPIGFQIARDNDQNGFASGLKDQG
ncbi:MAG: serine hydrolase domain-containing protein [Halanaerobiaceae bacterium]